jgi:hypothetical protein
MTGKNSGRLATRTHVCGRLEKSFFETHKPAMSWESRDKWDPYLNQTWFLKKH